MVTRIVRVGFLVAFAARCEGAAPTCTIGSFTNIRGSHVFPDLIRDAERKPIRIFLQDGVNDNRGMRGRSAEAKHDPLWDWHAQDIKMVAALTKKGYDMNYCWGIGTHSNEQAGTMLPEMLRWLWRDYPRTDDPHEQSHAACSGGAAGRSKR